MTSLSDSYQATLLSASVSGLVILWLITFAGEIYGDLEELRRLHLFRGIGWIVPVFGFNCINLSLQYSFHRSFKGRACATINIFSAISTFIGLALSAWEIRGVLKPARDISDEVWDMEIMLAALSGGWFIILLSAVGLAIVQRKKGEAGNG